MAKWVASPDFLNSGSAPSMSLLYDSKRSHAKRHLAKRSRARSLLALTATSERRTTARPRGRPGTTVMAASRPTIAPDEDIAALLERAQVSAPISDKVVPQLLAQDVGSVAALLEAGSSAMAGGDGAAGERAGGGVGTGAAEGAVHAALHAIAAAGLSGPRGGDGTRSASEEHGGGAAAGGEGRGGARPKEAEGGTGGGAPGAYMDPVAPALPASGDGTIAAAGGEEEVEGVAAAAEAGRRAPETLIVADPSATRHTDTGHSSQPLAASAGASDSSTYSGADAEEAVAGGGSGAAEASAAAAAEEDKRVRALRIALQHKTQMPVTDEEARAILQARGGRETPVTEEEARVIFRARGDAGRGRATFQARARGRGGRATASPALASKGGEELSRRGKKAVAKEAGEAVSREEGEAIYRATLESLLASTGWTPRAAEEMAREEQRAHVRQMRWAREHGRGEPVRCFDAEEYDEGDDAFDALFDGGSGYGWDSPSGGGAFF